MAAEPSAALRVVAIQPSSPKRKGPTHGAATRPHTRPSKKAPRYPVPPTLESRLFRLAGRAISNAPKREVASEKKTMAMPATTHGLPSALPNPLPVIAEATPIGVKRHTMPATKREVASEKKTMAMPATTHGLPSALPNPLPLIAEATPIGVKRHTMPATKTAE